MLTNMFFFLGGVRGASVFIIGSITAILIVINKMREMRRIERAIKELKLFFENECAATIEGRSGKQGPPEGWYEENIFLRYVPAPEWFFFSMQDLRWNEWPRENPLTGRFMASESQSEPTPH